MHLTTKAKPFERKDLREDNVRLLRDGRWGNACVWVAEVNGKLWTIKDFSSRHPLVRKLFGRFILRRELKAIEHLKGMSGVPSEAFMLDEDALAIEFIPGRQLGEVPASEVDGEYLRKCEQIIRDMHLRDLAHLDTRGSGNWLMRPDGSPALIDFQSSVGTQYLPSFIRVFMEKMDIGGVYKKWKKYRPEEMGGYREEENEKINQLRRLWVLRGYFGLKKRRKKENSSSCFSDSPEERKD